MVVLKSEELSLVDNAVNTVELKLLSSPIADSNFRKVFKFSGLEPIKAERVLST